MDVQQTAPLQHNTEYSKLANGVDPIVKNTIDLATGVGVWDLGVDERGRPLLNLRVRDQSDGQGSAEFAPDELRLERHLAKRLHDLKGGVIHVGKWRGQLKRLYADIRQWCRTYPEELFIREEPVILREERVGEYEAPCLVINSGNDSMRVEPIAAWVVGADGRVDLRGIGGPFTLLYSQREDQWRCVRNGFPFRADILTQELFLDLVEACLND